MIAGFYSDPHFGHENVVTYSKRPYSSIEEHDEALIANYNFAIRSQDTVIWLGDCFFMPMEKSQAIMRRLNGNKILVWGGHDGTFSKMLRIGFDLVTYEMSMLIAGRVCNLCHFPYAGSSTRNGLLDERFPEKRPKAKKGQVLIHGHTHSNKALSGNAIHVGVDAWAMGPALMDPVAKLVKAIFGEE